MPDNNNPNNPKSRHPTEINAGPIMSARIGLINLWMRLIQYGFSLLYHQFAWSYDAISWLVSLGAWRDWQRAALPFILGPRVLEIAFGPGHMLRDLNQAGLQVTGIDLSPQMSKMARSHMIAANTPVSILRASALSLPFASNSFDSILTTFPTEFFLDRLTLIAVHRLLREDGLYVIVPGAKLTSHGLVEKTIEWLYYVTGQRSAYAIPTSSLIPHQELQRHSLHEFFMGFGFFLENKTITLNNSEVTVLIARKIKLGLTPP